MDKDGSRLAKQFFDYLVDQKKHTLRDIAKRANISEGVLYYYRSRGIVPPRGVVQAVSAAAGLDLSDAMAVAGYLLLDNRQQITNLIYTWAEPYYTKARDQLLAARAKPPKPEPKHRRRRKSKNG